MSTWDNSDFKMLVEFLREREYLYNRSHQNYKIYTIVKECAEFGNSLNPPKSSKEVLDKITALRKDIRIIKQIVADDSTEYSVSDVQKFKENASTLSFMYTALFGKSPKAIAKLNLFLGDKLKRKSVSVENNESKSKKPRTFETANERDINLFESSEKLEDEPNYFLEEVVSVQRNILVESQEESDRQSHSVEKDFAKDEFNVDPIANNNNRNIIKDNKPKQNYAKPYLRNNELIRGNGNSTSAAQADNDKNDVITLKIINFIRNKPYYYKEGTDLYEDNTFKEKELNRFGKTFQPPLTSKNLGVMIKEIIEKFCNSVENPKNRKWRWFDQCTFLFSITKPIRKHDIKFPEINIAEIKRTKEDDPKLLIEVVTFIEDNPCFYDESDADFYNNNKKNDMTNRFKVALQSKYNEVDIQNMLESIQERINKQIGIIPNGKQDIVFEELQNDSEENFGKNNSPLSFIDCNVDNFAKKSVTHSVASIQCNLYEELLEQKIRNLASTNRNCNCIDDLISCLFSTADNTLSIPAFSDSLQEPSTSEWDMDVIEEMDEYNKIGNFLIETDFPDFSDISSDDGLSEIPFEESIPKLRPSRLPDGKIPCDECDLLFDDYIQLNAHEQKHGEKSLVCYKCGKINKYYRKLRLHENNCNPEGNKNCYECNVIFKNHLNYYDHQNQYHTKSNPYICVCRQAFTSYNKIITHLNRSDCGVIDDCVLPEYVTKDFIKGFLEQNYEDEEEFVKTMEKTKFWCKICHRNYVRNDVYMKHFTRQFHLNAERDWMRQFNIERIFPCDYCNNEDEPTTFQTLHQLVTHRHAAHHKCTLTDFFEDMENIAASEKPSELPSELSLVSLVCRICKLKYQMSSYKNHFRNKEHQKHERNWIINHNIKLFSCDICSEEFKSLIEYLEHKHDAHLEWPTNKLIKEIEGINIELIGKKYYKYYCSICDYKTNNRRFYSNHILIHGSHYKCSCGKIYKVYDKFVTHRSRNTCSDDGCIEFTSKNVYKFLN